MDITTILVRKDRKSPPKLHILISYRILLVSTIWHFYVLTFSAILELSDPVYFNKNIRPICLPGRTRTTNYHSQLGQISGWGKTGDNWATNLKETNVLIFKTDICKKIMHIQGEHTWDGSMGYNTISE